MGGQLGQALGDLVQVVGRPEVRGHAASLGSHLVVSSRSAGRGQTKAVS